MQSDYGYDFAVSTQALSREVGEMSLKFLVSKMIMVEGVMWKCTESWRLQKGYVGVDTNIKIYLLYFIIEQKIYF